MLALVIAACLAPVGVVANDGIDDAPAIQLALAAGSVCLPDGTYELGKHGRHSITVTSNRSLRGQGAGTHFVMVGDAGFGAWSAIRAQGDNITLADFRASAAGASRTEEQTHVVLVEGASTGVRIVGLHLSNPPRIEADGTPAKSGDCVRLLGATGAVVRGTQVDSVHFSDCTRTGLQIQRGVEDTSVTDATFSGTGVADIDVEATGPAIGVSGLTIGTSTFSGGARGDHAITVQCATGACRDVTIVGNTLRGRGIYLFNVDGATVAGNTIRADARGIDPTVWISKSATDVTIATNTVIRTGVAGPVFAVKDHNTGSARNVAIRGNTVRQATAGPVFHYRGARHVTVAENRIHRDVAGVLTMGEASAAATAADVVVESNQLSGSYSALAAGAVAALAALRGVNSLEATTP
jgi:hypothetical protein